MLKIKQSELFYALGVLCFLCFFCPWFWGNFIILAAGSGETISVRTTGMVTCPERLTWEEWREGAGDLTPWEQDIWNSELGISPHSPIVSHRMGYDRELFNQLTMYQAKYREKDGTLKIGPARGPLNLVGIFYPHVWIVAIAFWAAAILCWVYAYRISKPQPPLD